MLIRDIQSQLQAYLESPDHKIFFIWGPRRSGKTTQLKKIAQELNIQPFNFDLLSDQEYFKPNREDLQKLVNTRPILLIDEVQSAEDITVSLKTLFDEFSVKIIATGSSELRKKSDENFDSLANRYTEQYCLPLSYTEIEKNTEIDPLSQASVTQKIVDHQLVFGSYPEVYLTDDETEKIKLLENLVDTYVLKDIADIYNIKNIDLAKKILTTLALQVGSEVSYNEIANKFNANVGTISNYIEIFKKNYILLELPSFKTNARRAISENKKLFFLDLGIRNALIKDFRELNLRQDKGAVFENYVISEIFKQKYNQNKLFSLYFYREYGGKEVDLVLENYKKEYVCAEIKLQKLTQDSPFPLPHQFFSINKDNANQKIAEILSVL